MTTPACAPMMGDVIRHHHMLILLLAAVFCRAILGGATGTMQLCLGDHHRHDVESRDVGCCDRACSHSGAWPTPVGEKHEGCGCTDIQFCLIDAPAAPRDANAAGDPIIPAALTMPLAMLPCMFAPARPGRVGAHSGRRGVSSSDLVRCTRLNI